MDHETEYIVVRSGTEEAVLEDGTKACVLKAQAMACRQGEPEPVESVEGCPKPPCNWI